MWFQHRRVLLAVGFALTCVCYLGIVPKPAVWASQPSRATSLASVALATSSSASSWTYPVASHDVLRDFSSPNGDYSAGHRGVDFGAIEGESVAAVADGVVRFSGQVARRGVVSLTMPDGYVAEVEPVCPVAVAGDQVSAGQLIATFCDTAPSHCAQPCLHLSARRFSTEYSRGFAYLTPLLFLGAFKPSHLVAIGSLD